jgi:hypothetical protein
MEKHKTPLVTYRLLFRKPNNLWERLTKIGAFYSVSLEVQGMTPWNGKAMLEKHWTGVWGILRDKVQYLKESKQVTEVSVDIRESEWGINKRMARILGNDMFAGIHLTEARGIAMLIGVESWRNIDTVDELYAICRQIPEGKVVLHGSPVLKQSSPDWE